MINPSGSSTGDNMNNILAVTVTYGNRFHLLRQVIDAALNEGVNKVIVVDNNSEPESRQKLKTYHERNKDKVDVLYLSENLGSAGGFKRGLEMAYDDPECKFIWLLDDDNMPCPGSLETLKKFWKKFDLENKKEKLALLSFREDRYDRKNLIEALTFKKPELVLPRKNSFGGFHIFEFPKYIKKIVFKKLDIQEKDFKMPGFGPVAVTPYGGLFFNKSLLDIIGYPKEEFYVYSDDYEWTYRITRNGGKIILLTESYITDIDDSWHTTQKDTWLSVFTPSNAFRIYYTIRNGIYFGNYFLDNKFIYYLNMLLFLFFVLLHNLTFLRDITGFKFILMAIEDANKCKLGRNPLFQSEDWSE